MEPSVRNSEARGRDCESKLKRGVVLGRGEMFLETRAEAELLLSTSLYVASAKSGREFSGMRGHSRAGPGISIALRRVYSSLMNEHAAASETGGYLFEFMGKRPLRGTARWVAGLKKRILDT